MGLYNDAVVSLFDILQSRNDYYSVSNEHKLSRPIGVELLLPPTKNDPIIAQLYLQYATCLASASLKNRSNAIHAENTFPLERRSYNEFYRQNRI